MFTLDGSIVNVALPTLVTELGAGFATVQWIVLAYLLVVSSLVLGAARMGDLYGKKRVYLGGLALFTAASLGCALSPDVRWLIGDARGAGAGRRCSWRRWAQRSSRRSFRPRSAAGRWASSVPACCSGSPWGPRWAA